MRGGTASHIADLSGVCLFAVGGPVTGGDRIACTMAIVRQGTATITDDFVPGCRGRFCNSAVDTGERRTAGYVGIVALCGFWISLD